MTSKKINKETPLMKQYNQVKGKYPDAILLFRVGDFYETFGLDAVKTSKIKSKRTPVFRCRFNHSQRMGKIRHCRLHSISTKEERRSFCLKSYTLREFKFARNYFSRSPQCANLTSVNYIVRENSLDFCIIFFKIQC